VFHFSDDFGCEAVLFSGLNVFGEFSFFLSEFGVVAFEAEAAFAEARDGVDEFGEVFRIVFERLANGFGVESREGLLELCGDEVNGRLVNNHGFVGLGCRESKVAGFVHAIDFFLLFDPLFVAVIFPVGEVAFANVADGFAESFDDGVVWDAIANHGVDAIAKGVRETSDFAVGGFHGTLNR
jgi:hypothetical protein